MLFMGLDVGTQGVRCIVVNDQGEVIAGNSIAFGKINTAKESGQYRQNADDWWDAAAKTISACISEIKSRNFKAEEIASISIDGTSGTIVPLDSEHKPLCEAFMYNDMRARDEAITVHEVCGDLEIKMGLRFNASFSLPRILWIKTNMPALYEKTDVFAHQADYIVGMLTGEYNVSDYSNALKTGYDLIDGCWPQCITGGLGIDAGKLPKIVAPGTPIGQVTRNAASALGLSERTIVVAGSTDGYASALAAGAVDVGNWVSIIGTTMVLKGVTESLVIDPSGSSYSHKLPSGNWMLGGAANIGGRCLNTYFDKKEFPEYEAYAEELTPTGILSYPLIGTGERFPFVDPKAEAFIDGDVSDKKIMFAALMEGVGFAERLAFDRMQQIGCHVDSTIFTSGGACRSEQWLQIRSNILNRQLKVPEVVDAAMGSAMIAAMTHFGTLEASSKALIRFSKTVEPQAEKAKRYEELYHDFYNMCKSRYFMEGWR